MKKICVLFCFLILHVDSRPFLFDYHNKLFDNGYDFGFSSSDGIKRSETGQVISSKDGDILKVIGNYSYSSNDNARISVYFSAGEDGYRPKFSIESLGPQNYAAAAKSEPEPISTAAIASLAGA